MSASAARHLVAHALQRFRLEAGRSQLDASERIGKSRAVVGFVEVGRHLPARRDVEELLAWYGVAERVELVLQLVDIARAGVDWWTAAGFEPGAEQARCLGWDTVATAVDVYAPAIPWPLQTEAYAAAVTGDPQHAALVAARGRALLERDQPPAVQLVIDEAALRRVAEGPDVLHDQLARLADLPEYVTLQVIPAHVGPVVGGLLGQLTVWTFARELVHPGAVHVETATAGAYSDDPSDVDEHRATVDALRAAALSPAESASLIAEYRRT